MYKSLKIFLTITVFTLSATAREKPRVTIGVLIDGESVQLQEESLPLMERETLALLARDYDVSFTEEKILDGNWDLDQIETHLDTLLEDDEVDIVICLGVLSTLEAAGRGAFPKPVLAPFGISSDLPIYPIQEGRSGVFNFNYLANPSRLPRDADLIVRMEPVKKVHVVSYQKIIDSVPGLVGWVYGLFKDRGIEAVTVTADTSAKEALDKLGQDVEMVYVTPLLRFDDDEKRAFFEGLKRKQIPSVSLLGWDEVELGALAGNIPKSDTLRLFRRLALNIQATLGGEDPGTFPVIVPVSTELVFNMETARAVDWYPDWDLQVSAQLLNEEAETARQLTLEGAVLKAIEVNLDLSAETLTPRIAAEDTNQAKSQRLPQADLSVTGLKVDEDSAASSFGAQPEDQVLGSLQLRQLIFSDGVNAGVDINSLLEDAAALDLEIAKLDIAREAAVRFLQYLQAKTFTRIQRDNLALTRENLDTARIREEIGIAGRSDVFRWESQLAIDQQEAIEANAQTEVALASLNQVLHYTQESRVDAVVPSLLDPNLITGRGRLERFVRNEREFALFRGFMVAEGLRNVPELKKLDVLIAISQREILTNQRTYYLPTVALSGALNHEFSRSGAGADGGLAIPGIDFPERNDTSWNVAINVSIPVFQGGARKHALGQSRITLEQLRIQRQAVAEKIELGIRVSLQRVGSSAAAIDLSRAAADAAKKNYDLVRDAYARGVATSIDLLDAQNASLVADQAASNAVYNFLVDLMEFQRAAANFDFFITPAERDAFFEKLEEFYKQVDK
jgi:outer membrane protein TolC